ncbi:MAG: fluoride efflux transporter CrcB [Bacteroidetes bacterium]|nr:fluoride efflux transporter CrcB [Bacteroidota bacterium]
MLQKILWVGLSGALGSALRYTVSVLTQRYISGCAPVATLFINVSGCLLIGIFWGLLMKDPAAENPGKLFWMTGFCGGYTTFSAFAFENLRLLQTGNTFTALAYMLTSLVLGVLAVWLGYFIAQGLHRL